MAIYVIGLALIVMVIYLPVLLFPYLLLDDNWLVRQSAGTPDLRYIAYVQGRPVFAVLIRLMREFTGNTDFTHHVASVITVVRGLAIVGLVGFAIGLFRWFCKWGSSTKSAFITTVVAISLPSLAMYVLGGPWLTVGLVAAMLSMYLVLCAIEAGQRTKFILFTIGAVVVQGMCWATYQATAPIAMALLLAALVWSTRDDWGNRNHRGMFALSIRAKFIVWGVVVFVTSLAIYMVSWKLAYNFLAASANDTRYAPSAINLLSPSVVNHFFTLRLVQIFDLWDVRLAKGIFFWVTVVGVALAVATDMRKESIPFSLVKWTFVLLGMIFVDLPALSGNSPSGAPAPIYSYMTAGPLTVVVVAILGYKLIPTITLDRKPNICAQGFMSFIVLAVALAFSMKLVLTHFAVPLWLEYRYIRSEIERFSRTTGIVEGVQVSERKRSLLRSGIQEFSWSNLQSSFYLHWMVRNALDDLGMNSRIRIDVVALDGQTLTSKDYAKEPNPGRILAIDTSLLQLRR